MNNEKILLIEGSLEPLIKALLIEMKSQKKINEQKVNQVIELLSNYRDFTLYETAVSKSFMGKLFYMFSTLVFYAQFTKYESTTMIQILRLRVSLLEIFQDVDI